MKLAVIVYSDPLSGSEESLGRLLNALSTAKEIRGEGGDVKIIFRGTGTRWPGELSRPEHPFHQWYIDLEDQVAGVSSACAAVFGAGTEGTSDAPTLPALAREGYTILNF